LGIPVQGTLGVILLAKKEQHIDQIKPFIEKLLINDFRIAPQILTTALEWANEN